jgi:hypothetical protein
VPKAKDDPLFLDTSIQIARLVHGPKTKERIRERIVQHGPTVTGLVVRQEFKRRLLKEAEYLLRLLHRYKSFDEVQQHVIRLFGTWPGRVRKRNICLQTLAQVHGGTDEERTERLQLYLRSLLVVGLKRFDQQVDTVRPDSGCACARVGVVEKVALRQYELGPERCSRIEAGACQIVAFLAERKEACDRILQKLRSLPAEQKSAELRNTEQFLERLARQPGQARQEDPCVTVGDLLIALESVGVPNFFTLNGAESQHLCRALGQTLIVRPIDPLKPEIVCPRNDPQWPAFGKQAGTSSQGASGHGSST